jgi:DNA repair protein RadC
MKTKTSNELDRYALKESDLFLVHGQSEEAKQQGRHYVIKIKDLPENDKPREKLVHQGPLTLSLQELLAIVLTTGTKKENVLEMVNRLIKDYGKKALLAETDAGKMAAEFDIPLIKACQIIAVGELGRRFYERSETGLAVIRTAKDVHDYVKDMADLPKEHLRGIYLDTHNRVIHDEVISIGTINTNIVHPREVFRPALEYNAAAVVLAHNHPSGVLEPSTADVEVTKQLIVAGKMIGINLFDHVIVARGGFESIDVQYE